MNNTLLDQVVSHIPNIQDLKNLSSLLPSLFDQRTELVLIHGADGALCYGNPAAIRAFKCNNQSALLAHFNTHHKALSDYLTQLTKVLKEGQASQWMVEPSNPTFSPCATEIKFSPIFNEAKQIIGVLANVVETGFGLTDARQPFTETIVLREHYLRALLDSFPFLVWMKDKQGKFLAMNAEFAKVVGVQDVHEVEGKTDFDYFHAAMAQGYLEDDSEVMQTGFAKSVVEQIKRHDGQTYWTCTQKSPVKVNDEIVGTVGFSRDVSEEKRLQTEIAERDNQYAALVDNLPAAVVVYDLKCRRVLVNAIFSHFAADSITDFLGKRPSQNWSHRIVNMTGVEFEQKIKKVIRTGELCSIDIHCLNRDVPHTSHLNHQLHPKTDDEYWVSRCTLIPRLSVGGGITGVIGVTMDITEIYQSRKRVEFLAFNDALTGLPNRVLFAEQLSKALANAEVNDSAFAVMILDLDDFKSINDSEGHELGDKLLKEVARRITATHAGQHFCARLGGDEFAILMSSAKHKLEVELFANQLIRNITQMYEIDGAEYFISASIGVALYPEDASHSHDLMKYADSAMYYAKQQGRNHYQFYSAQFTLDAHKRVQMETALRYALAHNELFLEYQPIVDIVTKRVVGAEALCRWHSKRLGKVGPVDFIHAAERTGLIVPLGKQLMKQAFEAAVALNMNGQQIVTISVNLSARQFNEPQFVFDVMSLLDETKCQPEWVKFEITETLLLDSKH